MTRFLIGGYTGEMGGSAHGVGLAESRPDGRLAYLGAVARVESPSWLVVNGSAVLAVDESSGELVSLRLDGSTLAVVDRVPTKGALPCHIAIVRDTAIVSAYGSGTVSFHPLVGGVAGSPVKVAAQHGFGPHPDQGSARAHSAQLLADGRVLVADLGADRVFVYRGFDAIGSVQFPSATGPRDQVLQGDGRVLVLGELSGTLHALDVSTEIPTITATAQLPGFHPRTHAAAIAIDRGYAYIGLRRANRVAVVDLADGGLRVVGDVGSGGDWPRHLLAADGILHVSNQLSNQVASFRLAPGELPVPIGDPTSVPSPTQLVALPSGDFDTLQPLVE